ncbi:MAG: efflux RND transporter permease subunit [Crocosphaera sp.]
MVTLFYRNVRLLILTLLLMVFLGLSSFHLLPRMEDPEIISRVARITTFFPGSDAQQVESLITEKLEDELQELDEISILNSVSRRGFSLINIELKDEITKVDSVWSQVRNKLNDAQSELPPLATKPEFEDIAIKAYAMLVGVIWEQDNYPNYAVLRRRATMLADQFRIISGTEEVELRGEPTEEILVEINATELSRLGLTPQQVAQQIEQSDAKVAAGQLRNDKNNLLIDVDTELNTLEQIRRIPIKDTSSNQFTRLGDIAFVSKGIQEPMSEMVIVNGHPAIVITLLARSDQRLDQWSNEVKQTLANFQDTLPTGLGIDMIFDQTPYVETRLNRLMINLLCGAGLVFGVTSVMMGWQSALIVSSALPLSGFMVFIGMSLFKIPLHQMSITGLIVALGLLIDNAIIAVDQVQNLIYEGVHPVKAIKQSVRYLTIPLLASTITTICSFLPIALLPGGTGEFISSIGTNVIIALVSSLFLSLTIIPTLTALLTRASSLRFDSLPKQWLQSGFSWPWLTRKYRWSLSQILKYPLLGIVIAVCLPIIGFLQANTLEEQFFPPVDRDQFKLELEFSASTPLEQTAQQAMTARQLILDHEEVKRVDWFIGRSAPKFYYNLKENHQNEANYAQAIVTVTSEKITKKIIPVLQAQLNQAYPSARVLVRILEQGPPVEAPIEMRLYGSDLDTLARLGKELREQLSQIPFITQTKDSLGERVSKLELQLDQEKVRLSQLNNAEVAKQLDATLEGITGGLVIELTEQLPVRVRINSSQRGSLDYIRSLDLTANDQSIPLTAIGHINLSPEINQITRRNGQRVNTIQGFIEVGTVPATVLSNFKEHLSNRNFQLPRGYRLEIGGEAAERNRAVSQLLSLVGGLVIIMVATLVLSLGSFRLAGLIIGVGLCSVGLGLFALWFYGYPFGFMSIIGLIGLIGVAINDSIVVLAAIKEDTKAKQGDPQAIGEVVLHSTRHVLTTTLTTMIGFAPLLLDGGQFWPPLAVVLTGGIAGATLLALYFVPCVYILSRVN